MVFYIIAIQRECSQNTALRPANGFAGAETWHSSLHSIILLTSLCHVAPRC